MSESLRAALRRLVPRSIVHRQPLLILVIAVTAGILADSVLSVTVNAWLSLAVMIACASLVLAWFRGGALLRSAMTVLLLIPLAAVWHHLRDQSYKSASILSTVREDLQPAMVEGTVDRPAILRRHPLAEQRVRRQQSPWQTQLELRVTRTRSGLNWQAVDGRVLVTVSGRADRFRPGDSIRVYGSIHRFAPPSNPGEPDLRQAYRQRGLQAAVQVDAPRQVTERGQSRWRPGRAVATIAQAGRERLMKFVGEDSGPLAIALVIGQREFVSAALRDLLLVTGTVHLLSVSGLHLAIIVILAHWIATLLRFPRLAQFFWVLAICLLYTAITGARPPVVRAAVLVITFMFAFLIKRPHQPINTLSLAALVILLWNPFLLFGIGVQLSFLAVATLLLCRPAPAQTEITSTSTEPMVPPAQHQARIAALIEKSRSMPMYYARYCTIAVSRAIWYSGCVMAISTPLVWQQFHVVSPISTVTNVILSPLLFLALATGVATVVCGFIEPLGILFGRICGLALAWMREVIEWAAAVPYGHCWLPAPPTWWVITFYVVIAASLYLDARLVSRALRYLWIGAWVMIAVIMATRTVPPPDGTIEATFVDVGHGTCVVLRSGDEVWLYDCGSLGNQSGRSREIDATLWSLGITRINGVCLSHADIDHFNALPGILRRFRVDQVISPPQMLNDPEPEVARLRATIDRFAIPVREVSRGAVLPIGRHQGVVLHPPSEPLPTTDNANSLVLQIDHSDKTLILPGDLEPPGTAMLINQSRPPPGGVLMAPHHGSLRMDADAVLQWARPAETVVCGGRRAKRPAVVDMLSANGAGVHVTSRAGAIRVQIDPTGQIDVRGWRSDPW